MGEPGIPNVNLTLTDLDTGDQFFTTTDSNGNYLFENLTTTNFRVEVTTELENAVETSSVDNTISGTVAPGQSNLDVDFGYQFSKYCAHCM